MGFRETAGPFPTTGEIVVESMILPENPPTLVMVRLDVADVPRVRVIVGKSEDIVKSGAGGGVTARNNCATWESLPLFPVMFIV